ncbi:MAG: cupin domain-containing protein [Firmicutes bacterium]|nr:cupin domain-containing protein [Bacillota bacterium]
MDIGSRIREFRNLKGLTQQELADRAELTKGFISQLERNQNSPSISTLIDILQCLGTTPAEFFNDSHPEQVVFKKEDYFEKYNADLKNNIEWLIPNAQRNAMEPIRLCLEPGGSSFEDKPHEGEEFGFVLEGTVKIRLGSKTYTASKGEAFYYTANRAHYLYNSSKRKAVVIWVSTPPTF